MAMEANIFFLQQKGKTIFEENVVLIFCRSWFEAMEECELYGGHLVDIRSRKEQNCLMRYGQSVDLNDWYWHDGSFVFLLSFLSIIVIF